MKQSRRKALEKQGWVWGDAKDFLKLSDEEAALIEMKLDLAESLRALRHKHGLSQEQLAKMLRSSQSRVAKMESADRTVSIDLLMRALLRLGSSRRQLGRVVAHAA